MRKKSLTVVVASSDDARICKFKIPHAIVLAGGIFSILFLLFSFVASLRYSFLNYRSRDYDRLQTENSKLQD